MSKSATVVDVDYFTDPLCAWSWSMEPHWRRLRLEYGNQIRVRYRMVCLLPSWDRFHDQVNEISRPAQMEPWWLHISELTGMPINGRVWNIDPPHSSIPACLAVKAAEREGPWASEAILRRLREAVMLDGRNIARTEILEQAAAAAAAGLPSHLPFDVGRWRRTLYDRVTVDALREDLREMRSFRFDRIPALLFRAEGSRPVGGTGYRPFTKWRNELLRAAPTATPVRGMSDENYARHWGRVIPAELAVASGRMIKSPAAS